MALLEMMAVEQVRYHRYCISAEVGGRMTKVAGGSGWERSDDPTVTWVVENIRVRVGMV